MSNSPTVCPLCRRRAAEKVHDIPVYSNHYDEYQTTYKPRDFLIRLYSAARKMAQTADSVASWTIRQDGNLTFEEAHKVMVSHIASWYARLVEIHNDPGYLNPDAAELTNIKAQIAAVERDIFTLKEAWYTAERLREQK